MHFTLFRNVAVGISAWTSEFDPDCNDNFDSKDPIVPHTYVHFRILLPVDK